MAHFVEAKKNEGLILATEQFFKEVEAVGGSPAVHALADAFNKISFSANDKVRSVVMPYLRHYYATRGDAEGDDFMGAAKFSDQIKEK